MVQLDSDLSHRISLKMLFKYIVLKAMLSVVKLKFLHYMISLERNNRSI